MSLYAKIAQVQTEIGGMKTDRQANVGQYRYDYLSDSAIFAQVRHRLAPLGVATFVSVESEEQRDVMTVVHVLVTFVDESGEQFSIRSVGYGTDRADKGCGKAITSAVRYALTKTFLQGGDEDPEQEYIERSLRANGQARPVPEQPVEPSPEPLEAAIKRKLVNDLNAEQVAFIHAHYGKTSKPATAALVERHGEDARDLPLLLDTLIASGWGEPVDPDDVEVMA